MGRAVIIEEEAARQDEDIVNVADTNKADELTEESASEAPKQQYSVDDDIPEKYRGKSAKDLIRMHQEAEKVLGRHSSEVGELRKVVDEFIQKQSQPAQTAAAPKQEDDVIDFFADPDKAIARKIESHPAVQQAKQLSEQNLKSQALASLQKVHPDMNEILQNERFAEWVKESRVRTELLVRADQNYDTEAASELFSTWKALNGKAKDIVANDKADRSEAIRKASTGSVRGSAEAPSKKKYRRADIIKLMQTDPARYDALQPEIMAAYREGRVI
jgi:hypothetical protein